MGSRWHDEGRVFKTFVRGDSSGDGKKPAVAVKGKKHISTFDAVKGEDCFGAILNSDFIDVSFDDKKMYDKFLDMAEANGWKCLALPSTHGGHTYWRKPGIKIASGKDKKTAVGFVVDMHMGSTYIPLCVHGKARFPEDYDILDDEQYQTLPEELWPVDSKYELWQMEETKGRNDCLYSYILKLQAVPFDKDTIVRILKNINGHIFKDRLSDDEFAVITRDEAFKQVSFVTEGGKFQHHLFAAWLIANYHVIRIANQLFIYDEGVYRSDPLKMEAIMQTAMPTLRDAQRKEVMKTMRITAPSRHMAPANYIAFKNGILNLQNNELMAFTPDLVITNQIPWNYDVNAQSELLDQVLDNLSCGDPEIRKLLEQCAGYCLYRRNEMSKAFILTGEGANGKSTYLDMIKAMLGQENISALDLYELGDRFSTAMMFGKLANIGDDIGDEFLRGDQVAIFKKIVSGNEIKAEQKGETPFNFEPYCKLLFSANQIPRMKDKSGAVKRRLVIIPFKAVFKKGRDGFNSMIKYDLCQQGPIEALIRIGIEGLYDVLESQDFAKSEQVEKQLEEYELENNPIIGFLDSADIDADILHEPTNEVYQSYNLYCSENNFQSMSSIAFSKQLCMRLNMKIVDRYVSGRKRRVFEKEDEDDEKHTDGS